MTLGNVLVLDDDPIVRKALEKFLEKEKINVFSAENLANAKKIYETQKDRIDLALVDYVLPDAKDGEAVNFFTENRVPTVLLTATYEPKIRKLYQDKGLVDYVFKSIPGALFITVELVKRILKNKNTKVLIVDDAPTDRKVMRKYMEYSLFNVLEADSIKKAQQILKENRDIKLVFLDYNLPDEDPLSFVHSIRIKYPKTKLGIIIVSGYVDEDMVPVLLKSDVNDIIKKPFFREELVNRAYNILDIIDKYETLENMAYKDFLTGLYNRRYFFEEGKKILSVARRNNLNIAFVLFDVDKFKSINDTYGHDIGDIVLQDFANKLKQTFKREEDLVARLGGEEFALLTIYTDFENFRDYLLEFHSKIPENPVKFKDFEIKYTVSGGVATGATHSLEELYKLADEKLYKAKTSGRNKIIF